MEYDFYHILNRGVEKRKIFLKENDYLRFIQNLYDFNDKNLALPFSKRRKLALGEPTNDKEMIVDTLCWSLLPNHYHIFSQGKIEKGASIYSQKITSGYTQYFNLKNNRNGVLFQGKSKIIPIQADAHFLHIPYYILSNPIELIEPGWKEKGIKDLKKIINFLENYKYSSFPDLIGKNNFPEIINKELFYEIYNTNEKKFKKDFIEWLKSFKNDDNTFED